MQSLRVPE
ncbi:hypothetical protein D047_0636A, partial [Vibrio parahaemolyticus VPTS-2010_2]